jgi:hypothetical protein
MTHDADRRRFSAGAAAVGLLGAAGAWPARAESEGDVLAGDNVLRVLFEAP